MNIECNNVSRPVLNWFELTDKEQKEFDYLDTEDKQLDAEFARYKGVVYDLHEFMHIDPRIAPHPQRDGWEKFDGYINDTFYSGVLMKFVDNFERVIMATYYC